MKLCLICSRKAKGSLCIKCADDPFRMENYRDLLAKNRNYDLLKKTYTKKISEIKDLNTADFWDNRLFKIQSIDEQDGMAKDRIFTTLNFIPNRKLKILDIGAGYGFIEEIIQKRHIKVKLFGNDISGAAINNLKKRFRGTFKIESIYNMNYKNDYFDVVLLLEVLEHIPPSRTLKILSKINKLIKKDGYFILSVPMNEGLEYMKTNKNGHVRVYTRDIIFSELKISGFEVINYKEFYAFNKFYFFKKMLSKLLLNRWKPNNIVIKAKKK
ncbi:MAG TPA: class I SAM-dependent methyltransferase [Patescibacteria group bacterium]|nr:class I SAM-dependent methyltransferase [Patescibacteria group bacterium]